MTVQASKWLFSETPPDPSIRTLKPLLFDFFVAHTPLPLPLQAHTLSQANPQSFRPTITFKRMLDEHKFRLSVSKKRNKLGASKESIPQHQSTQVRVSKGSRVGLGREQNQQEGRAYRTMQRVEFKEVSYSSPRKGKEPHVQFNLSHLLKTSKTFSGQFNRSKQIQGSNFPYYQYFSSHKSPLPKTARKHPQKERQRLAQTTTTGSRHFHFDL